MDTKLTLKLDQVAIEQAKRYAHRQGMSLSKVVESYFLRLGELEKPGIVGELAGVLQDSEIDDVRTDYTEYLMKKYS